MKCWLELGEAIFQTVIVALVVGGEPVMAISNQGEIVFAVARERER